MTAFVRLRLPEGEVKIRLTGTSKVVAAGLRLIADAALIEGHEFVEDGTL